MSAGIRLINCRVLLVEFIQIKGCMCTIQLAGEENQYLLSKATDSRSYSLSAFYTPDTARSFANTSPHVVHTCRGRQL